VISTKDHAPEQACYMPKEGPSVTHLHRHLTDDSVRHQRALQFVFHLLLTRVKQTQVICSPRASKKTYTSVGKLPGNSRMESTSSTCRGASAQDFLRKLDSCEIGQQIPREFVHRGSVRVWAMGREKGGRSRGSGDNRWMIAC